MEKQKGPIPMPQVPPGYNVTSFLTVGRKRRWLAADHEPLGPIRKSERSAVHDAIKHARRRKEST